MTISAMKQPKRILLIDDDPSITELFAYSLTRAGYEVRVVNDAMDAVPAAVEFQPELILLDGTFPFMDGVEILSELRRTAETSSTRVAFFSGRPFSLEQLDELTFFIAKPVRLGAFLEAVQYALNCELRGADRFERLAA
jgi:DNA-binding response OmpR family regulator